MRLVKPEAADKLRPQVETARRDLIDGTIDSLIEALSRQQKRHSIIKNIKSNEWFEIGVQASYRQMRTTIRNYSTRSD